VLVNVFSSTAEGQLTTELWLRDALEKLSLGLAIVFLVLLAYALYLRLRPVLTVNELGISVRDKAGPARLGWRAVSQGDFHDGTIWVRPVPGGDLPQSAGLLRRWDPQRGAVRMIALADVNATPDTVYDAVARNSPVPVTMDNG